VTCGREIGAKHLFYDLQFLPSSLSTSLIPDPDPSLGSPVHPSVSSSRSISRIPVGLVTLISVRYTDNVNADKKISHPFLRFPLFGANYLLLLGNFVLTTVPAAMLLRNSLPVETRLTAPIGLPFSRIIRLSPPLPR